MRDAPIRVAFVLHVMQVAGAEMLVAEIIRRLGARIEPVVVCLDGVGQLGEQMRAEGVPVVSLGRTPGVDWRVAARVARELDRHDVEVVHAHQYTPFFYAALARLRSRRRRRHIMFTEHGRHYPDVVSPKRRLLNRLVLSRFADEVNAVCGFSAKSLDVVDGFGRHSVDVIDNGIDLARYGCPDDKSALRTQLGLDPARRYVICVARFHPVKDHATLLVGFDQVARRRPDVDLILAGDGPLRPQLERYVCDNRLLGRVHFLGVRHDVAQLLQAADVFALTSKSEAASITLLEAMASGLPSVVTGVGGNPELVREGIDGELVPRGDAAAVAAALNRLIGDRALAHRMGAAARARVAERFSLARTVDAYYTRYAAAATRLRRSH